MNLDRIACLIVLCYVLFFLLFGFCLYAESETPYYCLEHGELEQDEIVTLDFNNGRFYYVCKECVMNFILNNSEQVGLIMKEARGEIK